MSLAERGVDVLFLDRDAESVRRLSEFVGKSVQGDATDPEALAQAGFASCDVAVVAMGASLEASILATMGLKDLKVPRVLAKAASDLHGKVLARVGADQVVYPERDRAQRLARVLVARSFMEYMEVMPGYGIIECTAPAAFVGKPLSELRIRNVFGLTVVAIRRTGAAGAGVIAPSGEDRVEDRDTLVLFGAEESLRRFEAEVS
jgi:trk system potassium uptake protein TrkA